MTILQKGHKKASKLTLASVAEIRQLYGEGYTQGSIAKYAGVTIGTIGRIVRGETWCEGAGNRAPTALEAKASEQRALALMKELDGERAFEAEHAPAGRAPTHAEPQQQTLSPEVQRMRDTYLKEDLEPRRPPPSLLDGGDAPAEASGQGLVKLEEAAVAEGLDVEVALKRGAS